MSPAPAEFDRSAFEPVEGENFLHAELLENLAVTVECFELLVRLDGARRDAARQDAAQERIGIERRCQHAEGAVIDGGRRHVLEDQIEHRRQVFLRPGRVARHPAVAAGAVEHRKVELLVGCVEIGEEIENFVQDVLVAFVGPVDLVDGDDRAKAAFQRLRHDELGLRQRAFGSIDKHDDAIDHVQDTLDLATEVGMARRIDDVDVGALPLHTCALGENSDAALALEIVGVHGPLRHLLVFAEGAGLLQKLVDEGRLAMVDVRDNRDIAKGHFKPEGY